MCVDCDLGWFGFGKMVDGMAWRGIYTITTASTTKTATAINISTKVEGILRFERKIDDVVGYRKSFQIESTTRQLGIDKDEKDGIEIFLKIWRDRI